MEKGLNRYAEAKGSNTCQYYLLKTKNSSEFENHRIEIGRVLRYQHSGTYWGWCLIRPQRPNPPWHTITKVALRKYKMTKKEWADICESNNTAGKNEILEERDSSLVPMFSQKASRFSPTRDFKRKYRPFISPCSMFTIIMERLKLQFICIYLLHSTFK